MYVEMGPDTMTVNSISAQVVTSTDDELDPLETGSLIVHISVWVINPPLHNNVLDQTKLTAFGGHKLMCH